MVKIKPFPCNEKIWKIKYGVRKQGNEKQPKKYVQGFVRAFFHKVIQWVKNKSHEDRDGDSPAERRKKRNITEDAAEKIFIIPKSNIEKMIKEKTCQKFKKGSKEACKKKIQDVARSGVELKNIFSHQSHIFGCAE